MIFSNATISLGRPGVRGGAETSVTTGRRVQIDFPTHEERIAAAGAAIPLQLWDSATAGGDTLYRQNDVVTLTALDGHTTLPVPATYRVGLVQLTASPLAAVSVELHGEGGYQ